MMPLLPIGPDAPWLAPLAGFSDLPFRLLCREQGAAVACTEMISAKGLVYGMRRKGRTEEWPCAGTGDLLATTDKDLPLVVQLFGAEPEFLAEAASMLRARGFLWFDLNMGCSVPKVTKTGAGSALLREPARALAAASALFRSAGSGKAGCKIRLGWDAASPVYLDLAKALEDAGAAWITLHPRYAGQGFSGRADSSAWEKLVRAVRIPVLASGDLFRAEDALDCLRTGVSGVMFARGAMANPAIFRCYHALRGSSATQGMMPMELKSAGSGASLETETAQWMHEGRAEDNDDHARMQGWADRGAWKLNRDELLLLILRHAELADKLTPGKAARKGCSPALLKMRTVVPRYVRHLPGVRHLRAELAGCGSWEELHDILHRFFRDTDGPSLRA
jgi:tRNA-dihydrouridine synthase B